MKATCNPPSHNALEGEGEQEGEEDRSIKECGAPACGEQLDVMKGKAMGLYLLLHGPADIDWDGLDDLLPKVAVLMLFPALHADAAVERVRERYPRIETFPVWRDADRHERFELLQCRAMRWMQGRSPGSPEPRVLAARARNGSQDPSGIRELLAAMTTRDDVKDGDD